MSITVSLRDVVDEMQMLSDESTVYLNRKTGELITITQEEWDTLERDPETLADWEREDLSKLREIDESEDYLALPSQFDIHEYSIMERFCQGIEDDQQRVDLLNAIRGSGAFRYFKDTIHRFGIQDDWYRFRDEALERIAADWLDDHQIRYKR